jgi:hypothetical protein
MAENGDLVKACEIYWGEWTNYEDCVLLERETPETILISKDNLEKLPKECKTLVDIIINLPEEMFCINGKLKTSLFYKFVELKTGWSKDKIHHTHYKLAQCLSRSAH